MFWGKTREERIHQIDKGRLLGMLRKAAGLSVRGMAREVGIDARIWRLIENSGGAYATPQIVESARAALLRRGASAASLSMLDVSETALIQAMSPEETISRIWIQLGEVLWRVKALQARLKVVAEKLGIESS